jgi:hypothetical protein
VIVALYRYCNATESKALIDSVIKQAIEAEFTELEPTISLITFIANRSRLLNLPEDVLEAYQKELIRQIKVIELANWKQQLPSQSR